MCWQPGNPGFLLGVGDLTEMFPPATLSVAMFMTWIGYRWANSRRSSESVPAVLSGHCPEDNCRSSSKQCRGE